MVNQTTTVQVEQDNVFLSPITTADSDTHDFGVWNDGPDSFLDIMDHESRGNGHEDDAKEFVRLDIASMRVLYSLFSEPKVQALLASN